MKTLIIKFLTTLLAVVSLLQHQNALAQESIDRDPSTGDYTILYYATDDSGNETLRQTVFVPSTKIAPAIHSSFELNHNGEITYRYTVRNGDNVPQAIDFFVVEPVSGIDASSAKSSRRAPNATVTTPSPWEFMAVARKGALRMVWSYRAGGLWPTQVQSGFGLKGASLPGIIAAGVAGNAPSFAGLGENGFDPDSDLDKQFQQLVMHNYVDVWIAAPTIPLTSPVNVTSVLTQLRTHISAWSSQKLVDATLASNLDASFQAALTALSQSNVQQTATSLRAARDLVAGLQRDAGETDEQTARGSEKDRLTAGPNSLAVRVLLFDIRFLLRQLTGSDDS